MNYQWSQKAAKTWLKLVNYSKTEFGLKAARKLTESLENQLNRLVNNPEMGHPEPILMERKRKYRSIIFSKNFKLIYMVSDDIILLADIWDMRMNPEKLKTRI